MKEYRKYAEEMLEFIDKSPTGFHAVANLAASLEGQRFRRLEEAAAWKLAAGEGYYVTRNDSSLIAFRLPAGKAAGFHIAASHGDSPTFKVKESPEMVAENAYLKLNTEKYGGMILSSWLDRPLSVAGRVVVKGEKGIETRLINIEEDLMVIPSLAIHMSRDTPAKGEYNPQVDMLPLYGTCDGEKGSDAGRHMFMERVAKAAGTEADGILGHDLFLYVRDKGRILGENGDFVLSSRLDDLQCAYTSSRAFLESVPEDYINVCVVFDNEEVGSGTKQGAASTFLEDVLWRIGESLGLSKSEYLQLIAGSFLISADNAHAVHPNHPEKIGRAHV